MNINTHFKLNRRTKSLNILQTNLVRSIPIKHQILILVSQIIEDLVESAVDKAQITEYLKSAPQLMSQTLLSFLDASFSQFSPNIERQEMTSNIFGENVNVEPKAIPHDNWIRNMIKSVEKKQPEKESKNVAKSSKSTKSVRSMRSYRSNRSGRSRTRSRRGPAKQNTVAGSRLGRSLSKAGGKTRSFLNPANSFVGSRKMSMIIRMSKVDKVVLPEPVQIENELEEDHISDERKIEEGC